MQRTKGVSFLHPCVTMRLGRQAIEEKEEKKDEKREEKQERSRDCLSVSAPCFANKICRTRKNKGAKTSRERGTKTQR